MNKTSYGNPVYIALEGKFSPAASTNPEPVFEISIDPQEQKIKLEKTQGKGFLRFESTQAMFIQKGEHINIGLWSIKNKKLLGTLTNVAGQWSTEDLHKIIQELKQAGVKVKEKIDVASTNARPEHSPPPAPKVLPYLYEVFDEDIKDNSKRGKYALTFLWIKIGLAILLSFIMLLTVGSFQSGGTMVSTFVLSFLLLVVIGLLAFLADIIVFLFWLRRAYANLVKAGCHMNFPDWFVGITYFIPIISWFLPYIIIKEIWKKTQLKIQESVPDYKVKNSALINFWWIASSIFQLIYIYIQLVARTATTVGEKTTILNYTMGLIVIALPLLFVFPVIFMRIIKQEKRLYKLYLKLKVASVGE